jgi:tetratricopeptide (TPR) repeat protein
MTKTSPETIEQYRQILSTNPSSQIFVLLSEALRETHQLHEALLIAQNGMKKHPQLVSGRVSLGRILFELKKYDEAFQELQKVVQSSPENILAHQLLGEIYVLRRDSKLALDSFKKVLLLNPLSDRAQKIIQKLESLTAPEYEDEVFEMKPLQIVRNQLEDFSERTREKPDQTEVLRKKKIQNILSICDSFLARGNDDEAYELIQEALNDFGLIHELEERKTLILKRNPNFNSDKLEPKSFPEAELKPQPSPFFGLSQEQIRLLQLQKLLRQIQIYRQNSMVID